MSKTILWIEDDPETTNPLAFKLHDAFELIRAGGQALPQHTMSAGIWYLLEARADRTGEVYPMPDLILLDSDLSENPRSDHDSRITELCQGDANLQSAVKRCQTEKRGAVLLELIDKYICPRVDGPRSLGRPRPDVVYLSVYGNEEIPDCPGLLSGYVRKQEGEEWHKELIDILRQILHDSQRGLSLDAIRKALGRDADFLLGPKRVDGTNYPWSDTYRLALGDLVMAGRDGAWQFRREQKTNGYVEAGQPDYERVHDSQKWLPRAIILGERGTGKERFGRALHNMWYRGAEDPPFVTVNIGGFPGWSAGEALQARLFGSERADGGFAPGCVPLAWNGTLFMDEVGYANQDVQDTLLRLIQEGEYEPALSARKLFAAHCCFIGATNPDGSDRGTFRQDVIDRFGMYVVRIPALADMKDDLGHWMSHLLARVTLELKDRLPQNEAGARVKLPDKFEFPLVAANIMQSYSWLGNLRELGHAIRRMVIRSVGKSSIPLAFVSCEVSNLKAEQRVRERELMRCGRKPEGEGK